MNEFIPCRYCGKPIEIVQLPNDPEGYSYKHDSAGCILDHDPIDAPAVQVWEHDELMAALGMWRMTCNHCDNQQICRRTVLFKYDEHYIDSCSRWEAIP